MTIWTAADRAGLSPENVIFYERQGFIYSPNTVGEIKEYSDRDVERLKTVRLMRLLGTPSVDMRALRNGRKELSAVLDALAPEFVPLEGAEDCVRAIVRDGVRYSWLKADRYLEMLGDPERQQEILAADVGPKPAHPIRRFLARDFDSFLWITLIYLFMIWVLGINVAQIAALPRIIRFLLSIPAGMIDIVMNAVCISAVGTTPGKAILGMRLTDKDGRKMDFGSALSREIQVLIYGQGFNIPIYNIICELRCYSICENDAELRWEEDNMVTVKDRGFWQPLIYAALTVGLFYLIYASLIRSGVVAISA